MDAVEQAATLANATGFINELPDGMNTEVGERVCMRCVKERERTGKEQCDTEERKRERMWCVCVNLVSLTCCLV